MKIKLPPFNKDTLRRILPFAAMTFVICLASVVSFVLFHQLAKVLAEGGLPLPGFIAGSTPEVNPQGTPLPGGQPGAGEVEIAPSLNPWDGASRVTILILGLDYRDWSSEEGASRSDTMILLTLDPLTKTAGMLSIPRDLWVMIPGFQHGKINTAYYLGDAYKLPGGGPALAVKTVEQFLGVPINYYAQIDFGAFIRFIDEIGGVKIDVSEPITIDLLGSGFKTKKKLEPGIQVLPGEWALAYARARYTEGGDFDRARRQQQVIMAIRERIISFDMLPTLISKAPTLYSELATGIRTNLGLDEALKLATLAQSVPDENIQKGVIDTSMVLFGNSPDNLAILIPLPDKIHLLRDQIFASSGGLGPETPGSDLERMQVEGAKIAIYNGSSSDILGRTVDYLRSLGANIVGSSNAGQSYAATTIIDHTGRPFTLKYLVDLLHIRPAKIFFQFDLNNAVDVEVFLGDDWAAQNSLP